MAATTMPHGQRDESEAVDGKSHHVDDDSGDAGADKRFLGEPGLDQKRRAEGALVARQPGNQERCEANDNVSQVTVPDTRSDAEPGA
jgi:hypothetical protein